MKLITCESCEAGSSAVGKLPELPRVLWERDNYGGVTANLGSCGNSMAKAGAGTNPDTRALRSS